MAMTLRASVLNPGEALAEALVLDDPLSFWGGFDPVDGSIIDRHHPQAGEQIAGKVLVIPQSRGSAGTPAGIAESIRRGVGPIAVILGREDVNITVGAMVADRLYGSSTAVLVVDRNGYAQIRTGDRVAVRRDGTVTVI